MIALPSLLRNPSTAIGVFLILTLLLSISSTITAKPHSYQKDRNYVDGVQYTDLSQVDHQTGIFIDIVPVESKPAPRPIKHFKTRKSNHYLEKRRKYYEARNNVE
uniref:Secreted protein n=1 Tax=Parastrongyloides trichosuri TaxID=131310 RepID=A0A0N4ZEV1_PARTI